MIQMKRLTIQIHPIILNIQQLLMLLTKSTTGVTITVLSTIEILLILHHNTLQILFIIKLLLFIVVFLPAIILHSITQTKLISLSISCNHNLKSSLNLIF